MITAGKIHRQILKYQENLEGNICAVSKYLPPKYSCGDFSIHPQAFLYLRLQELKLNSSALRITVLSDSILMREKMVI